MRRMDKFMAEDKARALLARVPAVHLASTLADGSPVLRVLHPVDLDGELAFHGSPKGEKLQIIGRPAVASACEWLGTIPSYAFHPERACPATTWYRSVQVHGVVEEVTDPEQRMQVLRTLMTRFQEEGGHAPMEHAMHAAAVRNISILRLRTERISGKEALGQGNPVDVRKRIVEVLWSRGQADSLVALEHMLALPDAPLPEFLLGPSGVELCPTPTEADLPGVVSLLRDQVWNRDATDEVIADGHRHTTAWVVARLGGTVVATARALSDGTKRAWLLDVAVAPAYRGQGIGRAVVSLLLDHPRMRAVRRVALKTQDAEAFYAKLGFEQDPGGRVRMRLDR